MSDVLIEKDESSERAIPSEWRPIIKDIVEALRLKISFKGGHSFIINPLPQAELDRIYGNINSYGMTLVTLPDETWNTSACQWQNGYWDVLVDLFTSEEGLSDLALFLRVDELNDKYIFTVKSINVP